MRDESYFESRNLTAGQLNAIVKKLGGEWGALEFLRGELTACPTQGPFPRWMKLSGIGNTAGVHLIKRIEEMHMQVYSDASELLMSKAFKPRHGMHWGYLAAVLPSDLGLEGAPSYTDVLERGMDCGLELCDSEVGPILRSIIHNDHHDFRNWYSIAMRPLGERKQHFRLTHKTSDGTIALETGDSGRHFLKDSDERIVFFIRP